MIAAAGEDRRYIAVTFAACFVAALGTKLGEWAVERVRVVAKDPTKPAPPTP